MGFPGSPIGASRHSSTFQPFPRPRTSKASLWDRPFRTRRRAPRGCGTGATRRQEDPAMNVHRFAIGQSVRLKGDNRHVAADRRHVQVTGRMPARDWSPQYRISNDEGSHERVAEENNLEEVHRLLPPQGPCWLEAKAAARSGTMFAFENHDWIVGGFQAHLIFPRSTGLKCRHPGRPSNNFWPAYMADEACK